MKHFCRKAKNFNEKVIKRFLHARVLHFARQSLLYRRGMHPKPANGF